MAAAPARDALLIATGRYDSPVLAQLRSPSRDAQELERLLADPAIGRFNVSKVIDGRSYEIAQRVEEFFYGRNRDDLLLVHLSCHGLKNDDGELYFAATNTNKNFLGSTAMSAAFVHEQMRRCRARSIVLLLDCCFSGAFMAGAKGDDGVDLQGQLSGFGRAVLTATSRTEYAWEGDNARSLEPEPSRFTAAIVNGLATGNADRDGDGKIAVDELYEHVYEYLRQARVRQSPRMWAELEYRIFVADAHHRVKPPGDPAAPTLGRAPWPKRLRGNDAVLPLNLTLEEIAFGKEKTLRVETAVPCGDCATVGSVGDPRLVACEACLGRGALLADDAFCEQCEGAGLLVLNPCATCAGAGRRPLVRTLTVRIPAGIENGMRIRLGGEGEVGPGAGQPGDLYVEAVETPHPTFTREGDDIRSRLRLRRREASKGTIASVATLEGGTRRIRIAPGTRDGTILRLAGEGVPHLSAEGRGDHLITVEVGS
ncbi:caspase, EACC1-associated type [Pseudofrankia inefficax]|uniref:Chaperone DnaJ domain protein n=1 Tax=Pseudofrankia inefficax (strain DSM 45817 / CECT 9037 / DDB 130130 / EuI1c) TaxID=298654 RepID=E3J2Z3_PSEI1|nr:DnaJ C-terminal domain-containing protein [Pseudofrankia inefficax]ADP82943.1 chaperone DnaJ domain protein [Pseudofrankia inefficax]